MIKTFDYLNVENLKKILEKRKTTNIELEEVVREILREVKEKGDKYLEEMSKRFDCPDFSIKKVRVSKQEIENSIKDIPKEDIEILKQAISNVRKFHNYQREKSWLEPQSDSLILGQLVTPIEKVGLYVPGGKGGSTPLISTLIMNAVPAQIAGVKEIVVVTPPSKSGDINPYILATANLLNLTNIYKIGSAWAIGALAYGTESIPRVDMIVGPGNIYVTIAKKLLIGEVGIDMVAGPSEIVVVADESGRADFIAADLLSQAEHDEMACSILITNSNELVHEVINQLEIQVDKLSRREIARKSLSMWGAIITTPDIDKAIEIANDLAPEHLEIHIKDPWKIIPKIKNAGCVFLGEFAPEPVGDYFAGPNHVLPTTSTAKFSSGLSVQTFYKKTNLIWASRDYIKNNSFKIARMAMLEGLEAHAKSSEIRVLNKNS
ncbi:histidinol dehydrogenase [Desulfothermus okinawensis JCM 13304]